MIVKKQTLKLNNKEQNLKLQSNFIFDSIQIAYETIGNLNKQKDNAILICHAFSGDSHVAGLYNLNDKKPGWWDNMVGPDKAFDTNKFFVICSNILGGCNGTTGPNCINPATNKEYGLDFPVITIDDMVMMQKLLIENLGIKKLYCVAGGSLGGMQALVWSINYPEMIRSAAIIASSAYTSTQQIAFNKVGRNAIMSDPAWNNGNYYNTESYPEKGLAIARMIGHITYLSDQSLRNKFSRKLQNTDKFGFTIDDEFAVESYLEYKGGIFVERFDANSYLYITKAMDYFDLPGKFGNLENAFKKISSKILVVSFTTDWLYPIYHSKEIVKSLMRNGKDVSYCELESLCGHDAFLIEDKKLGRVIKCFLRSLENK